MKLVTKIFTIIIIIMVLLTLFPRICLAGSGAGGVVKRIIANTGYEIDAAGKTQAIGMKILSAIRNISLIITLIVITIVGIKYMVGSAEERAGYKKSMIPLVVGVIIIASAAQIAIILYNFMIVR